MECGTPIFAGSQGVSAPRFEQSEWQTTDKNHLSTRFKCGHLYRKGLVEALPVPRTRQGYQTQVFARYQRRQAESDEAKQFYVGLIFPVRPDIRKRCRRDRLKSH